MNKNHELNPEKMPEPWDRQPGESAKAFRAFVDYRDTPAEERSIRKTAQNVGKKDYSYIPGHYKNWAAEWKWVERAKLYDVEQDRQRRELAEKEREEMAQLHIKAARAMLTKALKGLQAIPEDEMTPNDVSRMIEVASKLERLSRGEPSESTEMFGREGAAVPVQIYLPTNGREKKEGE